MSNNLDLEQKIISFRRSLHQIPELDFDLSETRAFLLSVLEPLSFEIRDLGKAGFSVFIDAGKDETIAFRSDMDALAVTEKEDCAFGSKHAGRMHACGHDGHMSILLGLAVKAAEYSSEPASNCLLIFQAAEETNGGAKLICESGVLKDYNVSRIYGLHLWPGLLANTVSCRPGEFMVGMSELDVTVNGIQAHIANFKNSADALEAGCLFVARTYQFEKELPSDIFRILRFGEFSSGTANNIVSGKTHIGGTLRTYDEKIFDSLIKGMREIIQDIEEETGVTFEFEYSEGYPPLINPPELYEQTRKTLTDAGFTWFASNKPTLYAEDFTFYQREIPGLYMHLGMGKNTRAHSPEYEMNESVLITGTQLLWTLLTAKS